MFAVKILLHSHHAKGLTREWLNIFHAECLSWRREWICNKHGSHFSFLYLRPSPAFTAVFSLFTVMRLAKAPLWILSHWRFALLITMLSAWEEKWGGVCLFCFVLFLKAMTTYEQTWFRRCERQSNSDKVPHGQVGNRSPEICNMQLIKAKLWMSLEKPLKLNSVCQIVLQTENSADQQLDVKMNNGSRLTNVSGLNASPPHPTSLPQKVSSLNRCCSLQQGKSRKRPLPFGAPAEDKDERQRAVVTLAKLALAPRWWHFCENWAFFLTKTKDKELRWRHFFMESMSPHFWLALAGVQLNSTVHCGSRKRWQESIQCTLTQLGAKAKLSQLLNPRDAIVFYQTDSDSHCETIIQTESKDSHNRELSI